MKVAILGYARQGLSAYEYWKSLGADVTICDMDDNKQVPPGATTKLGADYLQNLDEFDLLVRTPRLHPAQIQEANPEVPNILDKVTTVTNEFFKLVKTPIIGITGTKGKGTTTLLAEAILKKAGKNVLVAGNIGISPLLVLEQAQKADYVLLELANFQTIDLKYSPTIGVCVKVSPEHLDWHKDVEEYIEAKQQMFVNQKPTDRVVSFNGKSLEVTAVSPATDRHIYEVPKVGQAPSGESDIYVDDQDIKYDGQIVCSVSDVKLLGRHNLQNVCAAVGAVWDIIDRNSEAVIAAMAECTGFEHRIEQVRTVDDVLYINDSFASAPEATVSALRAMSRPVVLIAGGYSKKSDYSILAREIAKLKNVKHIVYVGDTGQEIVSEINKLVAVPSSDGGQTMTNMVDVARSVSGPGDVVLLSTASASYGLFHDVVDRGDQFKKAVNSL